MPVEEIAGEIAPRIFGHNIGRFAARCWAAILMITYFGGQFF